MGADTATPLGRSSLGTIRLGRPTTHSRIAKVEYPRAGACLPRMSPEREGTPVLPAAWLLDRRLGRHAVWARHGRFGQAAIEKPTLWRARGWAANPPRSQPAPSPNGRTAGWSPAWRARRLPVVDCWRTANGREGGQGKKLRPSLGDDEPGKGVSHQQDKHGLDEQPASHRTVYLTHRLLAHHAVGNSSGWGARATGSSRRPPNTERHSWLVGFPL
jgi:hypothetical protein